MDFKEFYQAVRSDDQQKLNVLVTKINPMLITYLRINMHASVADAKDCVQEALLSTVEKIRDDKIKRPSKLYYYLTTTCRNVYLRMNDTPELSFEDNNLEYAIDPAKQLSVLIQKEKLNILKECMKRLNKRNKEYIEYWFNNPDIDATSVAQHFKISLSNAWTRKHRIVKILQQCVESKRSL